MGKDFERIKARLVDLEYARDATRALLPFCLKMQAAIDDLVLEHAKAALRVQAGTKQHATVQLVCQILRFRSSMLVIERLKGFVDQHTLSEIETMIANAIQPK